MRTGKAAILLTAVIFLSTSGRCEATERFTEIRREQVKDTELLPDVELVSTITEIEKESELILDNTPETEKKVVTDLQDTEADSSKVMISVEYTIEDQKLESGKTFEDIIVPEYAIAEDGNEVTGNVEWLDPDSKMVLDP